MTSIREVIRRRFSQATPLPAGIFQYQAPPDADFPYRLHLRLESDGNGILIVNAATVLHLNQTAAEFAYHLVNQTDQETAIQRVSSRYKISKDRARKDFEDFQERIFTLVNLPDLDPNTYLDFGRETPYSKEISAPYRLDCALTYQLPEGVDPAFAPSRRVERELSTDEWKSILDKAWEAGIPHIVFTGGEPTLRADLPELIAYAENIGQVTGLLSDGRNLVDIDYFHKLLQTGLDHLMITFNPQDDLAWKAIETVLPEDIFTTVHLTITPENSSTIFDLIDKLDDFGVTSLSLSNIGSNLDIIMEEARNHAAELDIPIEWDLPVPYSERNPVSLEIESTDEDLQLSGAGRAWLYIEPDGDVLREQGRVTVLGNAITGNWADIWRKANQKND
ncbi:MAG: radical SAM protein [Anaerolineales bacterium]